MMMLRNHILNGEFQLRHEVTPERHNMVSQAGMGYTSAPNPLGFGLPEFASISNMIGVGAPTGFCPGWGGGPGVGGNSTMQIIDRDFHDDRWPGNPERLLWIGWTTPPNPTPLCQQSGWETGSSHCAPSAWNDWRITILEQGLKRCEELLGAWVGYSFFAMAGSAAGCTPHFSIRPQFMTGYANGDYFLHDLQVEVSAVANTPTEVCGWFQMPTIPAGKSVNRSQFGIQFGLDTTLTTPPPLVATGFKVCRWPYPSEPDVPATEIKYMVEKPSTALERERAKFYTAET